jgi:hypothetical protein
MILSPVLLDRPFYQSEGKAVNLGSKSARARYLPLRCGCLERSLTLFEMTNLLIWEQGIFFDGEPHGGFKTTTENRRGFTEKNNCYRLRAIENY